MVGYSQNGVISLAEWKFSDKVHGDCSKWEVHMFWGDGLHRYFWFVGPWFGALTCSTFFYVASYICFEVWPPVVFGNGVCSLLYSGVSCSSQVVVQGKHPPSKFVVFW
jgi:hypothetical protein